MAKLVERRLAVVLAADVAGFSALTAEDETGTLQALLASRAGFDAIISKHRGRIANTAGDSIIAEFHSAVDAVHCAIEAQDALDAMPNGIRFRIGIHSGEVVPNGDDILGEAVNIAARLEALAEPGGILISGDVHRLARRHLRSAVSDLGEQKVKNIPEPVQVFAVERARATPMGDCPRAREAEGADKPSLAVLPFTNLSPNPNHAFFADGLVDDITTALSRLRWLEVTARNSAVALGDKAEPDSVGRDLKVRYVLRGSVRTSGSRLRVSAQLVETASGTQVWAERYDADVSDLFDIQDEITVSVVGAIEPQLVAAEVLRAEHRPPADLRAWECVARAIPFIWSQTVTGAETARSWLARAVAAYPDYAYAHALTGWSYMQMWWVVGNADQQKLIAAAEPHAQRASLLDPREPWVHLVNGLIHIRRREPEEAIEAFQRSLVLNPSFAIAYAYLGFSLGVSGSPAEGLEALDHALRLSPRDPALQPAVVQIAGMIHFAAGDYQEALKATSRFLRDRPDHLGGQRQMAATFALLGRTEEARAALARVLHLDPKFRLSDAERSNGWCEPKARADYVQGLRLAGLPE
ncbi:adenylate/guanylate cyclase domain-containing protein [Alsobacter sp. SYSU M60028]|uniref:Adenylate/guanylate cyclase domain-containing protein n=1 Tax=Alsobacter ponti TaxID=2962936 RepID=A0ABT1LIX9_9HYPH|nr:adenylate/guanylate cyclase domain-containing protein [Alsobacter ponti]MCP8941098.1 adenylate/guanylate cyclase domain-containing protein [Alsobacter ponti]